MLLREDGEGEQVRRGLLEQRRRLREALLELVDDPSVLLVHRLRVGLGEDRAHDSGDRLLAALGTVDSRLRMKWTRQRCQIASGITLAMAALRPSWSSLTTSSTPESPLLLRDRKSSW